MWECGTGLSFFCELPKIHRIMLVMFFSQIVRLSWYIKTIDKYESGLFPKRQDFKLEICGHSPQIFHQQIRRAQSEAISFVNVGISSMLLPRLLWVKYVAGNFRTVVWLPIAVIGIIIGCILSLYSLKTVVYETVVYVINWDVTGLHTSLPTGRSCQTLNSWMDVLEGATYNGFTGIWIRYAYK